MAVIRGEHPISRRAVSQRVADPHPHRRRSTIAPVPRSRRASLIRACRSGAVRASDGATLSALVAVGHQVGSGTSRRSNVGAHSCRTQSARRRRPGCQTTDVGVWRPRELGRLDEARTELAARCEQSAQLREKLLVRWPSRRHVVARTAVRRAGPRAPIRIRVAAMAPRSVGWATRRAGGSPRGRLRRHRPVREQGEWRRFQRTRDF